jgi:hypothetical protein
MRDLGINFAQNRALTIFDAGEFVAYIVSGHRL